ncbi:Uncharacterised protein [Vibrio cholerae]|nr:Uncharacterised protein [Vibrio cholerae]
MQSLALPSRCNAHYLRFSGSGTHFSHHHVPNHSNLGCSLGCLCAPKMRWWSNKASLRLVAGFASLLRSACLCRAEFAHRSLG